MLSHWAFLNLDGESSGYYVNKRRVYTIIFYRTVITN